MIWEEAENLRNEFIEKHKSDIRKAQQRCYAYEHMSEDYKNAVSYWNGYMYDLWKEFIKSKKFSKDYEKVAMREVINFMVICI